MRKNQITILRFWCGPFGSICKENSFSMKKVQKKRVIKNHPLENLERTFTNLLHQRKNNNLLPGTELDGPEV